MPLSEPQQQFLENWMRSKAIIQCPSCGDAQWQFAHAAYVRAVPEQSAKRSARLRDSGDRLRVQHRPDCRPGARLLYRDDQEGLAIKRAVIHIGMAKTGTTAIQRTLFSVRSKLLADTLIPRLSTVRKIAEALGIDPNELVGRD
jgi:hypothetical protein